LKQPKKEETANIGRKEMKPLYKNPSQFCIRYHFEFSFSFSLHFPHIQSLKEFLACTVQSVSSSPIVISSSIPSSFFFYWKTENQQKINKKSTQNQPFLTAVYCD